MPYSTSKPSGSLLSEKPLFAESTSKRLLAAVFALLVVIQIGYLIQIGSGVGMFSDGFSEANAVRAADGYLHDGFLAFHGLPRQAYGKRLSQDGFRSKILDKEGLIVPEMRKNLSPAYADPNKWVYMHYPEGPDATLALIGSVVGLDNVRVLRLFPLTLCLIAIATFFATLAKTFGTDRAAIVAFACVMAPMFNTHLPALHFQGYSFALFLFQMSILMSIFWLRSTALWNWLLLFLLGFLQGWLSFDQFFVIGLIALPLWLMRSAEEGAPPSKLWLLFSIGLPFAGFGFAHILHFLQVAGELGGLSAALAEFRSTAVERAGSAGEAVVPKMLQGPLFQAILSDSTHFSYLRSLILASYQYTRDSLNPLVFQFCPTLPLALLLSSPLLLGRKLRAALPSGRRYLAISWDGRKSFWPTLVAAFVVSSLWLFVMPAHAVGNHHITVRHFFVFYFFLVLIMAKSLHVRNAEATKVS